MRRRDFITLVGGVAAWLFASWAQQRSGLRKIGFLGAPAARSSRRLHRRRNFSELLAASVKEAGRRS